MTEFDVDPASMDIPIMKLSIQPFVENAIKYGWSPNMSPKEFLLSVKVKMKEDLLSILVSNTGTPIPAETYDKLLELLLSKGETIDPYFKKHTGIYNVYRRFMLAYDDHVDFNITTNANHGTCIEIRVPYRYRKAV
jgi:sensor histidine kinase YesM